MLNAAKRYEELDGGADCTARPKPVLIKNGSTEEPPRKSVGEVILDMWTVKFLASRI